MCAGDCRDLLALAENCSSDVNVNLTTSNTDASDQASKQTSRVRPRIGFRTSSATIRTHDHVQSTLLNIGNIRISNKSTSNLGNPTTKRNAGINALVRRNGVATLRNIRRNNITSPTTRYSITGAGRESGRLTVKILAPKDAKAGHGIHALKVHPGSRN